MPHLHPRPTILLTGFGPFPGVPVNASWTLVARLAPLATRAFPSYKIEAQQLATEWHAGTAQLIALIERVQPLVALHFGVSPKASGFVIETRGYNQQSAVADACGTTPEADCLAAGAPDTLPSNLPVGLITHRLRALGLPVEVSRDAGRYLCNAALYHSLDLARSQRWSSRASGFIHLPRRLHEHCPIGGSRLSLPDATRGGIEIIAACLGVAAVAVRDRRQMGQSS